MPEAAFTGLIRNKPATGRAVELIQDGGVSATSESATDPMQRRNDLSLVSWGERSFDYPHGASG